MRSRRSVPAAAQSFSLGGFGIAGGLGALVIVPPRFLRGRGRGLGPPGFMFHGGPGSAGRRFEGRSSWGQSGGQSQFRQRSPFGTYGGEQRSSPYWWPGNRQPSRVGTREFPARGNCGDGPCRPTYPPWRGQGHPSKVGTMKLLPGRRPPHGTCDGDFCPPKQRKTMEPGLDRKAVRDLLIKTAKYLSPADPDESSIAGIVDA